MREQVSLAYGRQDIALRYQADEYGWSGSVVLDDGMPMEVLVHTEHEDLRAEHIQIVQAGLAYVYEQKIVDSIDKFYEVFLDYKTRTLEDGNLWAEEFDGIESAQDLMAEVEDIQVYSHDGLQSGLECQVVFYCTWLSNGGVNVTLSRDGAVTAISVDQD